MRRQTESHAKQADRSILEIQMQKLQSYDSKRRHRNARGTLCSDESSKSEITFAGRVGLTTGILSKFEAA